MLRRGLRRGWHAAAGLEIDDEDALFLHQQAIDRARDDFMADHGGDRGLGERGGAEEGGEGGIGDDAAGVGDQRAAQGFVLDAR